MGDCRAFKQARTIQAKQASLSFMHLAVDESRKLISCGHAAADEEPKAGPIVHGQAAGVDLISAAGLDLSEGRAHIGSSLLPNRRFTLDSAESLGSFATVQATAQATSQATSAISADLRVG